MKPNCLACAAAGLAILLADSVAAANSTSLTGGSQPQTTVQPSLGITYFMPTAGVFSRLGDIVMFGGNFGPSASPLLSGQLLAISQFDALFSQIGTIYGGDGQATFALPDLRGRTPIGQGTGPGLTPRSLGDVVGAEAVTLTLSQLAAHNHTIPPTANTTSTAGSSAPYNNMQPSLALNYMMALQGVFPSSGNNSGGGTLAPFLAQVVPTARGTAPSGWAFCQGQLLPINQNQALFAVLGTMYGGNGVTTFALPDLRGRAALHEGTGPGLGDHQIGESSGVESVTLAVSQVPSHTHTLLPTSDPTGSTGGSQPQTNMQPTLALNYIMALQGVFPSREGSGDIDSTDPFLGQVSLFAGNFAPGGWALCNGQLLSIAQNTALFALLGTMYGGNGQTTFALPDLRGRIALDFGQGPGLSDLVLGEQLGVETLTLTQVQMPAHLHTFEAVPEPATLFLFSAGALGLVGWIRRKGLK